MAVLQINPAVREELFTIGVGGKQQLDEGAFAEHFVEFNHLKCYNGILYDQFGVAIGSAECQHEIYKILRGLGITSNMSSKIENLWKLIRIQAHTDHISVPQNQIAVRNGTITMDLKTGDWNFSEAPSFSIHRMNCDFNPYGKTKPPKRFLEWVDGLIHEADRAGFQEYLGYLLLPVTKLQKAMVLLGRGQEGKSRLGLILQNLLGASFISSSVEYFENNQFAMPRAENKLVLFQDDLKKEKLKSTEVFKMMVSAEVPMQAEQKHEPTYSFIPHARWVICSNSPFTALSDSGHGFFRRLYVIRVKNRPPDRKDDPFYFEPMKEEMDGIFIWMLQGLQRLIQNGWKLSVSADSQDNPPIHGVIQIVSFVSFKVKSTSTLQFIASAIWRSSFSLKLFLENLFVRFCREVFRFLARSDTVMFLRPKITLIFSLTESCIYFTSFHIQIVHYKISAVNNNL